MGISLSSVSAVLSQVGTARDVAFGSYIMHPGAVRDALVAAAERGAHVEVTLPRDPYGVGKEAADGNVESARVLRKAGATVSFLDRTLSPFHLKGAVCDGVAYLDDRNWTPNEREVVVSDDDPDDVELVRAALHGQSGLTPSLATRKDDALWREAALIDGAGDAPVIVETETFGGGMISAALRRHAQAGAPTTLIVAPNPARNPTESAIIRGMRRDGVDVRETGTNQKLALVGDAAWIGSANATFAGRRPTQLIDWGIVSRDAPLVGAVRAALDRDIAGKSA